LKYADDLVLLAKEEMVLQGTIERLIDVRRCYGMEINVGMETEVMRISRQPSLIRITIDQKQSGNVEYFKCFGSMITNDAR
jgi:ABC-type cobalamin/Fe3+-siderophores transport system ATPase subunit